MSIGLFGGTFDPVHNGHLKIASEMLRLLNLSELRFIPCALPSHRNLPLVSACDRAAMLDLAIETEPRFVCDRREIDRIGPSFTIDTLVEIRKELGPSCPLIFLMGSDAVHSIDAWKQWKLLLNYTHLFIVNRPGVPMRFPSHIWEWVKMYQVSNLSFLDSTSNGHIFITPANALEVSATEVRNMLGRRLLHVNRLLPSSVFDFVKQNDLYLEQWNNENRKSSFVKKSVLANEN
ncbi:MAG: nicotinate-nucleotide adenylyltransferase [Halieaceae bacterium]|nr:nicotinate-nucleotide adenylyltransferase [Halieaceae bacterium]